MRRDAMYAIILVGFGFFLMSQRTGAAFSDTETHLYKDAIHYVQDQGIVRGYSDGTYRPDQAINRAEFVKIIVESAFPGATGAHCFPDVRDEWFAPFVCTAKDKGFVGGYPDGTFKPDKRVNFAEAAKIIVTSFTLPTTPDPVWYKPFTNALREHGATPPSIAQLDQELSRGEMAAIIFALKGGKISAPVVENNNEEEALCDLPPLQRQFENTPYYTGPLFDDHYHMPTFFKVPDHPEAPVIDKDISRRDVVCLFDKERIKGAFAFYSIPVNLKDSSLEIIREIEQQYPGVISHFLEYVVFPGYPVDPEQIEEILDANTGLFKGYGEISLYLPHYRVVEPNDSAMKEFYKTADKHNLIVMMHPVEGQQQAIEEILRDYPNVQFLFHAAEWLSSANMFLDTFLEKYPNAHYSVDTTLFGMNSSGRPLLDTFSDKQAFVTQFKQKWQSTLKERVTYWKSKIEKHPDQFLWGTDRGSYRWTHDQDIEALLEEYSRAFIGKLAPAVQEKFAYKNAERLLQER